MTIEISGGHVQIGDGNTQVVSGRCATCKYWRPMHDGPPIRFGRAWPGNAADKKRLGLCARIVDAMEAAGYEDPQALTEDLSGCSGLRTAATFGCVLWETK